MQTTCFRGNAANETSRLMGRALEEELQIKTALMKEPYFEQSGFQKVSVFTYWRTQHQWNIEINNDKDQSEGFEDCGVFLKM